MTAEHNLVPPPRGEQAVDPSLGIAVTATRLEAARDP
jgi:hypothetical protein